MTNMTINMFLLNKLCIFFFLFSIFWFLLSITGVFLSLGLYKLFKSDSLGKKHQSSVELVATLVPMTWGPDYTFLYFPLLLNLNGSQGDP